MESVILPSLIYRSIKEGIHSFIMKEGNCNNAFSELKKDKRRLLTEKETIINRDGNCNFL